MAIGYYVNSAALAAIVFGLSPFYTERPDHTLISCYGDIIQACSHAENPYCAPVRLETCDNLRADESPFTGPLAEQMRDKRKLAAELIIKSDIKPSDQRTVRLIPLDKVWRSQNS